MTIQANTNWDWSGRRTRPQSAAIDKLRLEDGLDDAEVIQRCAEGYGGLEPFYVSLDQLEARRNLERPGVKRMSSTFAETLTHMSPRYVASREHGKRAALAGLPSGMCVTRSRDAVA